MFGDRLSQLLLLSAYFWGISAAENIAQITPDTSLGNENSTITKNTALQNTVVDLIEGGAVRDKNLLHSFGEFNVLPNQQVYFANPQGIEHIFTHVTGNNISEIFGKLGVNGNANLFLLNPNGIVFGENASLDVGGSFLATTADSLVFQADLIYSASNPDLPLLKIKIPQGLQFGSSAGSIEVRGSGHQLSIDGSTLMLDRTLRPSGLEVSTGNTLALVGGEIKLDGGNLTASDGRIELASVAQSGQVKLKKKNQALVLDFKDIDIYGDINLTQASSLDISGDRSGDLQLRGRNITLKDSSAILASKFGSNKGGEIDIVATDSLNIIGDNINFPSTIFTQTTAGSQNRSSNINIKTTDLNLQNNALIVTTTAGKDSSGNIRIEAKEADFISSTNFDTGLFSKVLPGSKKKGGKINLKLQNLQLPKNELIISEIDDLNDIDNDDLENLIKETNTLFLRNGGQISLGDGDRISIDADNIQVLDTSIIDNLVISPPIDEPVVTPTPIDEPVTPSIDNPVIPPSIDEPVVTPTPIDEPVTPSIDEPVIPPPIDEPVVTPTPIGEPVTPPIDNPVDTNNVAELAKQASIFNRANDLANNIDIIGSDGETETSKILLNSLLFRKSSNFGFNLTSSCRIHSNDYFVEVGKGGLPESPLTNVRQNIVVPDWDVFSQSFKPRKYSQSFSTPSSIQPIIEAEAWKINQNGKVELIATSDRSNLANVRRTSC